MKILESYKKIAKSMLTEHAWDRKFGEPLPTLDDVMKEASQDDEDYVHIGYGKYKDADDTYFNIDLKALHKMKEPLETLDSLIGLKDVKDSIEIKQVATISDATSRFL